MFSSRKVAMLMILVMLAPIVLAACGPTPEPEVIVETVVVEQTKVVEKEGEKVTVIETVQVEVTSPPEPTPEPTEPPPVERVGAWLDTVIVVEEPSSEAAVSRLEAGEIDVYAYTVSDSDIFATVEENPDLVYTQSYGSYNDLTVNPSGPIFEGTGKLNPFAVPRVREAMNWLIDRTYIVQEIMGGLAVPKWFPITSGFPDYARYVALARELEARYAYDAERAEQVIAEEMEALGAEKVNGQWQYEGEPVTLIFLIRVEDERREIGDYIANQIENLGFSVDRQYKTSAEASPLWILGNPADGLWHLYTGGWITTAVSRDQAGNFLYFYNPASGYGFTPLWQAYTPTPEFDEVSKRLNNNDFATMEERGELFRTAMELALQDSVRLWLVDRLSFTPRRARTLVTADLAGAVAGAQLWPYTLRFKDEVGGSLTMAMPSILTEPWNPLAGSNWIYDQALIRAIGDRGVMADPYTGLRWPQRIERAEVTIKEGLPVAKTLDWVSLEFVPEIEVPEDAWIDWDATEQRFLTVGEVYTQPLTTNSKTVVYYPAELYEVQWHDGSRFDLADLVMFAIMMFDPAKPESAIHDEATVPALETLMGHFKGLRIVSEDPLVFEWYDDAYQLDAEICVANVFNTNGPWPIYNQGEGSWHALALGYLAEASQELAFSPDKADALEVEYMSYIGGPSLDILKKYLDQAQEEGFVPYEPTLGQYVTAEEAADRWANYQEWYRRWGHFWVGTGPFRLEGVFPVEGTVILKQNARHPDLVTRWQGFGEPQIATVDVDGPGQVTIGDEAIFDIYITFEGEPYPLEDLKEVKYLLYDGTGALILTGVAGAVGDGHYQVVLDAEQTSQIEAGSNKIEVAVVPSVVSIPSFASAEFITAP